MEGSTFLYITLEVTTDKSLELIPTMRVIEPNNIKKPKHIVCNVACNVASVIANWVLSPFNIATALARGTPEIMLQFGGANETKIGSRKISVVELCKLAEQIRLGMGKYSLLRNNCQHFCNNVLTYLRLPTTRTTVGPETTAVEGIDNIENIFTVIQPDTGQDGGTKG
jgi:hypothetical protein